MSRLIHAGSVVVDHVYRIDRLPEPGGEKTASSYDRLAGGGFNLMVAARRCGMEVLFAGKLGTGPNGDFLRSQLERQGIAILPNPFPDSDSGNCTVLVTADAERTFVSWSGAEGELSKADLSHVKLQPGDWAFTSGYALNPAKSGEALKEWFASLPGWVSLVFDPAPIVAELAPALLQAALDRTGWLSCNLREAEFLAGADAPDVMAARLLERCPRAEGVLIRLGEAGAYLCLHDGMAAHVPGYTVEARDTNGAGDVHIGAFISALARDMTPLAATRHANAAAAISVTRHGGSSAPVEQEILDFLLDKESGWPDKKKTSK